MKRYRYRIALVSAVVWTALILGLYYWVHKPLTPSLARALGGAALDVATGIGFVVLAGGLGRKLLIRLDLTPWSRPERAAAEAVVGLGALSLLILAVGVVWLSPWSMAALLLVMAGITGRQVVAWVRDLIAWVRSGFDLPLTGWTVVILLAFALVMATLPPTKWDVLTYHLAGPSEYVQHGRFYAAPHNHFLGFPQIIDTLYAGELALTGRLTAGGVLHWLIGGLMLLMVGGFTTRHAGRTAGWIAVAALLVAKTVWLEMTFAYVDLMLMALAIVVLAVLELRTGPVILLGVLAGFALGTKYTAFWIVLAVGLVLLWMRRRDGLAAVMRAGAIYGGVALLVMLPWLVRNTIWYHNPLYPFYFESADMDSIRQDWYNRPESGLAYGPNAWQIPIMPLAATIFGVENAGIYASDVGPLFALLIPLLALVWARITPPERVVIGRALALALIMTVGWIALAALGSYINIQTRLVLYIFPLLAVVAGITLGALRRLPVKPFDVGFIVRAMVGLVLVFTVIDSARLLIHSGAQVYYSGDEGARDAFLSDTLGWYKWAIDGVNDLPPGAHVRFLWEPRTLYCDRARIDCQPDSLMDAWYYARRTVGDGSPGAIAATWREADFLLVYDFGRRYERDNTGLYTPADWTAWDAFVRDYLVMVWQGGSSADEVDYILYEWR